VKFGISGNMENCVGATIGRPPTRNPMPIKDLLVNGRPMVAPTDEMISTANRKFEIFSKFFNFSVIFRFFWCLIQ
jgi:hypothetical protein